MFVGWQKRLFHLSDRRLCYFHNEEEQTPAGIFNFEKISARVERCASDKQVFSMSIDGVKREFKLKAPSEAERDQWVDLILKHISSVHRDFGTNRETRKGKFWKLSENVDEQTFLKGNFAIPNLF